jgi:cell division protein FtsX
MVAGEATVISIIGSLLASLAIRAVITSQAPALRQISGTDPYNIPWTDLGEIAVLVTAVAVIAAVTAAWGATHSRA